MRSYHAALPALAMLLGMTLGIAPGEPPPTASSTAPATTLKVAYVDGNTITLSFADFGRLPREEVKTTDRDGKPVTYAGVPLWRLLELADAPLGPTLRGPEMALYVVVEAADGYKATLSLAEADDAFGERHIIVADTRDGVPLPANAAPFQLIVPQDRKPARWVRMVSAIEVRRAG